MSISIKIDMKQSNHSSRTVALIVVGFDCTFLLPTSVSCIVLDFWFSGNPDLDSFKNADSETQPAGCLPE